jgi:HSP20 family protein
VNRKIRLRRLEGQISEVAYQFTRLHFSGFRENEYLWRPAVNIFLCSSCLRICVELAGVDSEETKIHVSPGWLSISGSRTAPEPSCGDEEEISASQKAVRVLAMEISYGNFERSIEIPPDYDLARIHTEWENGLLWIFLPRRAHA